MARKRNLLLLKLPSFLRACKYILCSLLVAIILSLNIGKLLAIDSDENISPNFLILRGNEQLYQGQAESALNTWKQAYQAYQKLEDKEGMNGSLVNESFALQSLGSNLDACRVLIPVLNLQDGFCEISQLQEIQSQRYYQQLERSIQNQPVTKIKALGLNSLGNVLNLLEQPEIASIFFRKALQMASELGDSLLKSQILLNMGNSERLLFIKAKFKYQLTDEPIFNQKLLLTAEDKFNSAMNFYNQSQLMKVNQVEIKSQLNKLDLLIEVQTSKLEIPYNKSEIQLLINQLLTSVDAFDKLPVIDSIYSKTKLAENLMQINEFQFIPSEKEGYLLKASSLLEQVLVTTERINDIRDKSYTLGIMSKVQAQLGNKFEQQKYLEQAAELAQSVEAWDIAYKWQSQLGFLYQQAGENEKADKAYQSAIESLDYTQSSVVASNPEFNFTFKEKIAPIYQQYIELLLSEKQADLHRVIRVLEKLKSAEIQTFIRCGKIPIFSLLTNETGKTLPPAIYLIKSRNIEVIVKDEKGFLYRNTVDINLVNKEITNLSNIINSGNFSDIKEDRIIHYTNALYNLLLSPVKQYLPDSGNLIFVIDSFFQNLPLSMLHDGKRYLIESYNISISTGSQFIPNSELNKDIKVLAGGISEVNPSFKSNIVTHIFQPLPEVKKEIESIKQIVPTSILLNKDFTQENLKNKFKNEVLKIVHLSTHGQFSSDPEQTFILSWDSPLNISAIKNILENKRSIIDLLVLSACQTAKGDKNSLLGIAGITSQAGARSTLATLWVIESESTVKLMTKFYKSLKMGLPKAAALRNAQLALISDSKYSHPYYWAALVLVGSWV